MKISSRCYHVCFLFFCFFFFLIFVAFALMQTSTFKQEVCGYLIKNAEKAGIALTLSPLKGLAPLKWSCDEATIELQNGRQVKIEHFQGRVALFPLLKGQISFLSLYIEKLSISSPSLEEIEVPFRPVHLSHLPVDISIKALHIKEIALHHPSSSSFLSLSLLGKIKMSKDYEEIQFNIAVQEPLYENTLHLDLNSSKKKDQIQGKTFISIKDSSPLSSFFALPLQIKTSSSMQCKGKWSYWQHLKTRSSGDPLLCHARMQVTPKLKCSIPWIEQTWDCTADVAIYPDLSCTFNNTSLQSRSLRSTGGIAFSPSFTPKEGALSIHIQDLSFFSSSIPLSGQVDIQTTLTPQTFTLSFISKEVTVDNLPFSTTGGKIDASWQPTGWSGSLSYFLDSTDLPISSNVDFLVSYPHISFHNFDLSMQDNQILGSGSLDMQLSKAQASLFLHMPQLIYMQKFLPNSHLEGKLGGNLSCTYVGNDLSIEAQLLAKNIRYKNTIVNSIEIAGTGNNLLEHPLGDLDLHLENLLTRGGQISHLTLSSHATQEGSQEYAIHMEGLYKEPFSLSSSGLFLFDHSTYSLNCQSMQGTGFNQAFHTEPFFLKKEKNSWNIDHFTLHFGEGLLHVQASIDPHIAHIETKADHLPLDVVSLLYPEIGVRGFTSFQGRMQGGTDTLEGHFLATIEESSFSSIQAKGSLQAHLSPSTLQLHTYIYGADKQFIDWSATLPTFYPFQKGPFIDKEKNLYSECTIEGTLSNIFDFLQLTDQKIDGRVNAHMFVSGTLQRPLLQGQAHVQGGTYENYFTGIQLQSIAADIFAEGSHLDVLSSQLQDIYGGTATIEGSFEMNPSQHFPFHMTCVLDNFALLGSPTLQATTTGALDVQGDTKGCQALGNLDITKAKFQISDKIVSEIPTLPITYIHKPIHLEQSELILSPPYPLHLDLHVHADNTVTIKGKGLDSLWRGDIHVTGTPLSLKGSGSLTLEKGEFSFATKTFTLIHGDLSFSDKSDQTAYLTLSGQLKLPSATIIANLQGPLSSPRITFQSIPQLPTSSILALMLFNKDVSEISTFQALQLAHVIMSLSGGGGPDVLESIRKTIGVDRFQISGKEGSDEIALQIGWCVAHGVTVSLSQSASSSDITVEVDLKNGFLFEAESQNQEEGKFSLKWNCNY